MSSTLPPLDLEDDQLPVVVRAPLVAPALALCAGIAWDLAFAPPTWLYIAVAVAAVTAVLLIPRIVGARRGAVTSSRLCLVVAAACAGGVRHEQSFRRISGDHVVRFVGSDPMMARVSGTVLADPIVPHPRRHFFSRWSFRYQRSRFPLRVDSVEGVNGPVPAGGLIDVSVDEPGLNVHAGDRVTCFGWLRRPRGPSNPGGFEYARWLARRGVRVTMRCRNREGVTVTQPAESGIRALLSGLRRWSRRSVLGDTAATLDDPNGDADQATALVETVVLGRRGAVDRKTERRFIRTGTSHYLAVSGAHVGVVAWLVWQIGRFFGGTRRRAAGLVMVAVLLFGLLVDPRPSVLRAVLIAMIYCAGLLLRRESHGLNSTALAAIILLLVRPTWLFDVGFQMSFAAVTAIILLCDPIRTLWYRALDRRRASKALRVVSAPSPASRLMAAAYRMAVDVGAIGLAAWLAVTPIAWAHFGRVAPLGWFNSLIVFPFFAATLVTNTMSFATDLFPLVGRVVQPIARASADALLGVVDLIDSVSFELHGPWGLAEVATCVAATGALIVWWSRTSARADVAREHVPYARPPDPPTRRRRKAFFLAPTRGRLLGVGAATATVLVIVTSAAMRRTANDSLRITWLAVGPGTATVIELPDGRVWLYDCGSRSSYDVGERVIAPFCRDRGIDAIERVIISHSNLDHFSGIMSVLDHLTCGPVCVNEYFRSASPPDGPAAAMFVELKRRSHPGETHSLTPPWPIDSDVTLELLWPISGLGDALSANERSTVIRLAHAGRSVLLCGDIEAEAMESLLRRGGLKADVLVWPHHGSIERNTAEFVSAVDPSVCIVSSHRRRADLPSRLADIAAGRTLMTTADDGAVTVTIGSDGSLTTDRFRHRDDASAGR